MKKSLLIAACLLLSLTCARAVEFKLAHVYETNFPWHIGAERAAKAIEEKTGGRVKIKVFPSSVLGSEGEITEQVLMGGLDIAETGSGQISNVYKPMNITSMPYIFLDNAHAMKFIKSEQFAKMKEDLLKKTGGRIIGSATWGVRHIIGNRGITKPDDLTDFKLRVPDQRVTVQYAIAMGAKPTPTAYGEAYMALQQNVVDGLENPITAIKSMKFDEVAKHLSLTGHVVTVCHFLMSEDSFQQISKDDQKIFLECFAEASEWIHDAIDTNDKALIATMEKEGVKVYQCDRDAFARKTRSMSDEYKGDWSDFGDLYDYIQGLK